MITKSYICLSHNFNPVYRIGETLFEEIEDCLRPLSDEEVGELLMDCDDDEEIEEEFGDEFAEWIEQNEDTEYRGLRACTKVKG